LRLSSLDFGPIKLKCCKAAIQQFSRVRPLAGKRPQIRRGDAQVLSNPIGVLGTAAIQAR
jgi:hypothetical protein